MKNIPKFVIMNEIGHFRVCFKANLRTKPCKYSFSQERFCTQLRLKRESFWNSVGLFHEINFKTRRTCLTVLISRYLTISSYYLFTISLLILSIQSIACTMRCVINCEILRQRGLHLTSKQSPAQPFS